MNIPKEQPLLDDVRATFDALCDGLNAGLLTPDEWHNAVLQALCDAHLAAFRQGQPVGMPPATARQNALAALIAQAIYLNVFTDAIERGVLSDAQIRSRLSLYDGPVRASYWRGVTDGYELPFFPGDGSTPCHSHCKCRWEQRGDGWYWRLGANDEHCGACRRRADGGPY